MFTYNNVPVSKKIKTLKENITSFEQNTQPRYQKVIQHVRNMNSVVIHDVAISGESVFGIYSILTELTFLRLCIENDLYHPHLYRWCVGVSVGSVVIVIMLNTRYLYECHSKEIALDYLKAVERFMNFKKIRKIFFSLGENKTLGDFAPMLLLKNLFYDGALCSRQALIELLQGNHVNFKFDNKKQYFTSKEYYNWLKSNRNLDNVFIVCYAQSQTKMVVFTGNDKRFLDGTNFIDYEKLTYNNLIHAVICSSSITLLYPQPLIKRDRAIDGAAAAEVNQFLHLQILINATYYSPFNVTITPLFLFFGIEPENNNNFLIIINKRTVQYRYEDLLKFKQYSNPLVNSISTLFSMSARRSYNAKTNVPLTALYLCQPYAKEFSTNNISYNILDALQIKNNILKKKLPLIQTTHKKERYIPSFLLTEEQFHSENDVFCVRNYFKTYKEYKNYYYKYNSITSNLIVSSSVYGFSQDVKETLLDSTFNDQLDEDGNSIEITFNFILFDQFVRTSFRENEQFELNLLFKRDTGFTETLKGMGFFLGNTLFDIHIKQSLYTMVKSDVKSDALMPFVNEIAPVFHDAVSEFLGPKQG